MKIFWKNDEQTDEPLKNFGKDTPVNNNVLALGKVCDGRNDVDGFDDC